MRILILGDGDFSFTRAILSNLINNRINNRINSNIIDDDDVTRFKLVSTSFDSDDTLALKYPSYNAIKSAILKTVSINRANVDIIHGIDATKPLIPQIQSQSIASSSIVSSSSSSSSIVSSSIESSIESSLLTECDVFDEVIFNFPHLGIESVAAHSSLIAHIFHSVAKVMKPNTHEMPSNFVVALTETQFKLWNVEQMARRNSFSLESSALLLPTAFPGYEMKRHHVGRSFRRQVDFSECRHYVFRLRDGADLGAAVAFGEEEKKSIDICSRMRAAYLTSRTIVAPLDQSEVSKSSKRPSDEVLVGSAKRPKKANTIELMTAGLIREVVSERDFSVELATGNCEKEYLVLWECLSCLRQFPSVQGVRTHAYTAHVLRKQAEVAVRTNENENRDIACVGGELTVSPVSKPEVSEESSETPHNEPVDIEKQNLTENHTIVTALSWTCDVCGLAFESSESLHDHITRGVAPTDGASTELRHQCQHCHKYFRDLRAVTQHEIACKLKPST